MAIHGRKRMRAEEAKCGTRSKGTGDEDGGVTLAGRDFGS